MAEADVRFRGLRRACSGLLIVVLSVWCLLFGVTYVEGASMEPELAPGDVVVYRRGGLLAGEGDIVLFDKEDWTGGVLHRVIGLEPDGSLRTQGDANAAADRDPVTRGAVRGVVVAVMPLGKAWRFVQRDIIDVLESSTNRMMKSDDGEA